MEIIRKTFEVSGQGGTLSIMADMCDDYKNDVKNIDFKSMDNFFNIYKKLQRWYKKEKGEQLQRPNVTNELQRCDCDCQCIYVTCLALYNHYPIYWVLCGSRGYTHIFPIVKFYGKAIYFDMLPNRHFNQAFDYKFLKIYNYF